MFSSWQNKEIFIAALMFASTKQIGSEEIEQSQHECTFNALLQLCLLSVLIWLMLIFLQVTKQEWFYYKRDVTAVVFETRSPTEAFKLVRKSSIETFTQTDRRALKCLKYDVKCQTNLYRRKARILRRHFTGLRKRLAYAYMDLKSKEEAKRKLLKAAKERLFPLQDIRDRLMCEKDDLIVSLDAEIQRNVDLCERFRNVCVSGNRNERVHTLGAGDFLVDENH